MSKRLYPHNRVRYWYAYDLEDVCAVFADIGLHPQTIRKWTKNGLKTIDAGKPALIYGQNLIEFLKASNCANKCKTAFHEMYCMSCQDARPVFQTRISVKQKVQFLQVQGVCRLCKKQMFKNYKLAAFTELRKSFKLVDVSQLYDDTTATDKTHICALEHSDTNASEQGELF